MANQALKRQMLTELPTCNCKCQNDEDALRATSVFLAYPDVKERLKTLKEKHA